MLYLGIDQHCKQLTVDLGNEAGDVVLHRRVRTDWESVRTFLSNVQEMSEAEGGFIACLEVCGFNDYLLEELRQFGCQEIVLVQPPKRREHKTDRRDAQALRDLLWIHRDALRAGKRLPGIRRVRLCTAEEAAQRQVTALRKRLGKTRTRTISRVHRIVRKHNLQHDCPTKSIDTKKARAWLAKLSLPEVDRLEVDILLEEWRVIDTHLERVSANIEAQYKRSQSAQVIASIPGMQAYSSLAISSRIGDVNDFARGSSLANFVGLVPGCHSSGESSRIGSITKQGSSMIRFILGQVTLHVLRRDSWMKQWYKQIKRRRGTKIARVAVMRRLITIIWAMLKHDMPYVRGGPEQFQRQLEIRRLLQTT
jgi:transposase